MHYLKNLQTFATSRKPLQVSSKLICEARNSHKELSCVNDQIDIL